MQFKASAKRRCFLYCTTTLSFNFKIILDNICCNVVKKFVNEEFGTIRTITIDSEPWFVAKDVCNILESWCLYE